MSNLDTVFNELNEKSDYNIDVSKRLTEVTFLSNDVVNCQYFLLHHMIEQQVSLYSTTKDQWPYDRIVGLASIHNTNHAENYQYSDNGA